MEKGEAENEQSGNKPLLMKRVAMNSFIFVSITHCLLLRGCVLHTQNRHCCVADSTSAGWALLAICLLSPGNKQPLLIIKHISNTSKVLVHKVQ